MFALSIATDLSKLVQGGQLYRAFPFSKGSLNFPMTGFGIIIFTKLRLKPETAKLSNRNYLVQRS
jgi:hypothetical protein